MIESTFTMHKIILKHSLIVTSIIENHASVTLKNIIFEHPFNNSIPIFFWVIQDQQAHTIHAIIQELPNVLTNSHIVNIKERDHFTLGVGLTKRKLLVVIRINFF